MMNFRITSTSAAAVSLFLFSVSTTKTAFAAGEEKIDSIFVNNNNNNKHMRRGLQQQQQQKSDGGTVYEYTLNLNATTPLDEDVYQKCIDWPSSSNPENFTWWGFRIQLPDDAETSDGQWFSDIAAAVEENGLNQPYNETTPWNLLNYTFTSSEDSPIIKMNINDDVLWDTYIFDEFESKEDGEEKDNIYYEEKTKQMSVWCITSQTNHSWGMEQPVDTTLTISLSKTIKSQGDTSAAATTTSSLWYLGSSLLSMVVLMTLNLA